MDAPHISTLDSKEDSPQSTEAKSATTTQNTAGAVPSTVSATRAPVGRAPVYVDEDEEDQLIDDDDDVTGPPSRSAHAEGAENPLAAIPERMVAQSSRLTPTPSVVSVSSEAPTTYIPPPITSQPSQGATPRKRVTKPRKTDDAPSIVPTSPMGSAPKKKRNRTAIKATLEVGRQEPETHDNTGTTSAWRLDGGTNTTPASLQMTIVQQDEMSIMGTSSAPKQTKRKRAPKATAVAPAPIPPAPEASSSVAPPPRKRQRTQQAKPPPPQDEGTPDYSIPPILQDIMAEAVPYDYYATGPPTHVDQFRIPENGVEEVSEETLKAAPLRPVPRFTNTVAPGSFVPWQTYTGPLEKTGKQCRKWTPVQRSIKTIGGGVWFAKTWVGGETSQIEHVRPPLVVEQPKASFEGPAPSVASESEKPTKLPRTNKPRERKLKVKAEGGGSASATATPPTHASTPVPPLMEATAELEKLAEGS